jgi:hypothetical protein
MKLPTKGLFRITIGLATLLIVGSSIFFKPTVLTGNGSSESPTPTPVAVISAPSSIERETDTPTIYIPPVVLPLASHASIQTEEPAASEEVTVVEVTEDRTRPIYEVYKEGVRLYNDPNVSWRKGVDDSPELQWMIRDFANEYGYREDIIFGMIIAESGFKPRLQGDGERSHGLCQINRYWLSQNATNAGVPRFGEGNPKDRDLLIPYDNLLTLMEIWEYARVTYNIDISTDQGMKDLLYWHNTGSYRKDVNWSYSNKIFKFAAELITIEYND